MSTRSKSKPFKACRSCKALVDKDTQVCPICGSREFTDEWSGVIVVINPEESTLARVIDIKHKGRFVVKTE